MSATTDALTNLGQAIAYEEQLQAAVKLYVDTGDEFAWDDWDNLFTAILGELHTARHLLGGE